jgi:hypothetical protein
MMAIEDVDEHIKSECPCVATTTAAKYDTKHEVVRVPCPNAKCGELLRPEETVQHLREACDWRAAMLTKCATCSEMVTTKWVHVCPKERVGCYKCGATVTRQGLFRHLCGGAAKYARFKDSP